MDRISSGRVSRYDQRLSRPEIDASFWSDLTRQDLWSGQVKSAIPAHRSALPNKLTLVDPTCYRSVRYAHGPAGPVWGNWRSNQFDLVSMCSFTKSSFLSFPKTPRPITGYFVVSRASCLDFIEEAYALPSSVFALTSKSKIGPYR